MRVKNIFVQKINDDHVHRLSEQQSMCNVAHLIGGLQVSQVEKNQIIENLFTFELRRNVCQFSR